MNPKKLLFIGMGAIGSLYASKCDPQKTDITCYSRSDALYIKDYGIKITHPDNSETIWHPKSVIQNLSELTFIPDYIVIATKVLEKINVIDEIVPFVGKKTTIVLLQNGICIEPAYREVFPENPLISCLAFVCVTKTGQGQIHHQDYGRLVIGNYPEGISDNVMEFNSFFDTSSIQVKVSKNIKHERYKKLIWNAPFNPLSVIYKGKNTLELLDDPQILQQIKTVMSDVQCLAKADGCDISDDFIQKNLDDTYKMKPYKTSMCIDWERGRELEIEAILGNALRKAHQLKCAIPSLQRLYEQLKPYNKQDS